MHITTHNDVLWVNGVEFRNATGRDLRFLQPGLPAILIGSNKKDPKFDDQSAWYIVDEDVNIPHTVRVYPYRDENNIIIGWDITPILVKAEQVNNGINHFGRYEIDIDENAIILNDYDSPPIKLINLTGVKVRVKTEDIDVVIPAGPAIGTVERKESAGQIAIFPLGWVKLHAKLPPKKRDVFYIVKKNIAILSDRLDLLFPDMVEQNKDGIICRGFLRHF